MEQSKPNVIRFVEAKGKNKRITILLLDQDGEKAFLVHTKTLQDFKTRRISETKNFYSVETFSVIANLMQIFMDDSEITNKIIHRELSKIIPFKADTNIKQH